MLDILFIPFEYLMKFCLIISGNYYFIALFFFALIMQIVLLPLAIKQHKSTIMQKKMRPKEMAIRNKYKGRNDRATQQKMTLEIQEMYKENGYNQFASCLPLLLQLPIILILFSIVRSPIQYSSTSAALEADLSSGVIYTEAVDLVNEYKDKELYEEGGNYSEYEKDLNTVLTVLGAEEKEVTEKDENGTDVTVKKYEYNPDKTKGANSQMELTKLIQGDKEYFVDLAEENGLTIKSDVQIETPFAAEYKDALPKFDLFGVITLLDTPPFSLNILLLIPLLVFITSYFGGVINRKIMGAPAGAENNPMANGWFMKWGMPAMSCYFAFQVPAAVGVYWIWRTVVGGVQPIVLNRFYPMPVISEEEIAAFEKEMKKKKKKKVIMIEVDEDDETYRDLEIKGRPAIGSEKSVNNSNGSKKKFVVNNKIEMLSADDDEEETTEEDTTEK